MYSTLSPLIQAALTPVFMLTAIGMTLGLIDTRLNRMVDRVRVLEDRITVDMRLARSLESELDFFMRRVRRITRAAGLCTLASLFVAVSIVVLFIDGQIATPLALLVETMFICSVLSYSVALVMYLQDVLMVNRGLAFVRDRVGARQHDAD